MIEAQEKIRALFYSNVTDENHRFEFDLFNVSVTQKLWSTEQDYKELVGLDINDFQEPPYVLDTKSDDIAGSKTQSISTMTSQTRPVNIQEYCRHLNRLLDGFFMNSLSALDALAHQIRVLYDFPLKGTKPEKKAEDIYISKIRDMLLESHPKSEVGRLLQQKLKPEPKPDWFLKFESLRNCTTHESLIGAEISPVWDQIERCYKAPKIILPDDPKEIPFTYIENREAISFCQTIFDNIESLLNEVYEAILTDIQNNNNILPIGKP